MTGNTCVGCVHLKKDEVEVICDAFPDGIPPEIISGLEGHRKPVKGDNGIQWEPQSGMDWMV